MENNKELLYDWVFWFNTYESQWFGIHRETIVDFFSGMDSARYFRGNTIESVMDQIHNNNDFITTSYE
jgi:hypothetical protein